MTLNTNQIKLYIPMEKQENKKNERKIRRPLKILKKYIPNWQDNLRQT